MLNDYMNRSVYDTYEKIVKLVKEWDKGAYISKSSISRLKARLSLGGVMLKNSIPLLSEVKDFFGYISHLIPEFRGEELLEE
jgi:hypothetical protein